MAEKALSMVRKIIQKVPSILLVVLIFSSNASAEEILAWKDCVLEAKQNHPDLAAAREKLNQSKDDKMIAQSGLLPQVSGSIDAGRSKSSTSSLKVDSYSYGISGSELLFDGFKTYFDVEKAVKNIEASRYNYEVISSDVRLNLRTAFIDLLKAEELLRITDDIAKRRKQSRDLIQLRYEAGREHKGSLMTAEANLAQADFEVEQARRNIVLSQRRFLTRLGRSRYSPVKNQGDLDLLSLDRAKPDLEKIAETTPFLQQLIVLKEAAKWNVKSSVGNLFPQVYANASTGKTSADWPPKRSEWSLGASMSIPIFEGGSRIGALSKAKSSLNQAEADEKSGRNGVLLTLEEAWDSFQDAVDLVGVQRMFLNAASERSKIAESEYSTGLITFNDWIIIEDNLVNAKKNYLNARANALAAEAGWRQAKGDTLDEE